VEKHEALGSAVAQIERQFGKGSIMRMGDTAMNEVAAVPTGALALDIALGIGGIPRGRIVEVFGPESSGKTTLLYHLIAQAQIKKMDASMKVSDEELQKYYDAHKSEYEEVKARHILIAFKGSPAAQAGKKELTEDEAKAKAEAIRKEVAGGADFATVAKRESDDTGSGAQGGDLGSFGHGQMVPEFEKAAFEAKPGEITPVIRTQYGYHIIQVQEHNYTPFAGVKATIEKNERQKKMQAALDELKSKATFNETYFPKPAPPAPPATPQAPPATPKP